MEVTQARHGILVLIFLPICYIYIARYQLYYDFLNAMYNPVYICKWEVICLYIIARLYWEVITKSMLNFQRK